MRRVIVIILSFILVSAFCNQIINSKQEKEVLERSPYYLSFASIGAISLESRLDCWARIKKTSTSEEIRQSMENILETLNFPVNSKGFVNRKYPLSMTFCSSYGDFRIQLTGQSDEQSGETYFILSLVSSKSSSSYLRSLPKILSDGSNLDWTSYYLFTGRIDHSLSTESQQKILHTVMKTLESEVVESFHEKNIVSMTGYSQSIEKISPPVLMGKKKYNVQVAARSNWKEGKTYIYIGSPLIMQNY
ncbi:MAG: YwmB family TATA-box binding protein [Syntrophomonas sp.]|uniref:YwmB family TATA-box binding protein n=1 Tax=Syntrophomonas sp. TaxID=2053627 RepID=UPI0026365E1A|nr:YwmB family TATA-box binding protein [Syntrophomonas sp.]MDD2509544.1 YwmB family TATA-box binding protein [Syntrophomonas sp.]MDD3878415.1 YwmB family TATA-box binding protein [Syntrophomonas sp.]MDD4625486.1 YwmB family TATA-box binding protein [Syntrophomonas sp.]